MSQTAEPLPLYHRVYLLLRQQIADGAWPTNAPMPGEHELAAAHGVSRITIRRALERLEAEGMVRRRRGAGTFTLPPASGHQRADLRELIDDLIAMGSRTDVRLIDAAFVPAPSDVAAQMEVEPGSILHRSVRVRSAEGLPFSHLTAWVPEEIGRHFGPQDLAQRPLLALLAAAGAVPARAEQVISARLADSVVAPLLGVDAGSALLWVRRQVRDEAGRVIEWIDVLYRPELYDYQIEMVRHESGWALSGPAPI